MTTCQKTVTHSKATQELGIRYAVWPPVYPFMFNKMSGLRPVLLIGLTFYAFLIKMSGL